MKLNELKRLLAQHPETLPRFILPDGNQIPAHYHITEVGHVTKRFIDCGGKLHDRVDTCVLQTWFSDRHPHHRLKSASFGKILGLGAQVLPHDDLEVEVEYEDCAVTQFPIRSAELNGERLEFRLGEKHTDCLAKERCGCDTANKGEPAVSCC